MSSRAPTLVAALLSASCADRLIVEVALPDFAGTRALILGPRDAPPTELWILHPGDTPELPSTELAEAQRLELLALELGPEADGYAGGRVDIVGVEGPSAELAPRRVWATELTANDESALWRQLDAVPEAMRPLRVTVPCPTLAQIDERPVQIPAHCPFAGPPRPEVCYGRPRRASSFTAATSRFRPAGYAGVTSFVHEGGVLYAYYSTDRVVLPSGLDYPRPARVRMRSPSTADTEAIELLPVVPPLELDPRGWTAGVQIRADALEMFMYSSLPDAHYWDDDLYHAWRARADEPWTLANAGFVTTLSDLTNGMDPEHHSDNDEKQDVLLLPDYKTLIFTDSKSAPKIGVARRKTTDPSDVLFERQPDLALDEAFKRIAYFTLSCDRRHLIYTRTAPNPMRATPDRPEDIRDPRIVEILSLDPLVLGEPGTVRFEGAERESPFGLPVSRAAMSQNIELGETPGCEAFYITPDYEPWVAERVPCP